MPYKLVNNGVFGVKKFIKHFDSFDKDKLRTSFIEFLSRKAHLARRKLKLVKPLDQTSGMKIKLKSSRHYYAKLKKSYRTPEYDFTSVKDKINTRYLFEIYVKEWGYRYPGKTYMKGDASIYDIKHDVIVWRYGFHNMEKIKNIQVVVSDDAYRKEIFKSLVKNMEQLSVEICGVLNEAY